MANKIFPILVVLLLSCIGIIPLLNGSYFPMHDDTQPTRIFLMAQALHEGQFPVRWVEELGYGYGYPLFNFYSPLPYYFGGMLVTAGLDAISATKIIMGLGLLLAPITMYFLGTKLWGKWGGSLSALFYMFAPYHALQLYVRGAVAELWAYGFLPLIVLGMIYLKEKNYKMGLFLGTFGLSATILSHNITGLIATLFLVLYTIGVAISFFWNKENYKYFLSILGLLLLSIGLTAFFWLPAVTEAPLTKVENLTLGTNDFRNHFVYLDQLWDSPWGFAGSAPGRADGMSFKIGKLHILLAVFALGALILIKTRRNKTNVWWVIASIGVIVSVFMMLDVSMPVWNLLNFLKYAQYPWRFLVFTSFFISLLAGTLFTNSHKSFYIKVISLGIIATITIFLYSKYFWPQILIPANINRYTQSQSIRSDISRISDEYLPKNFPVPQSSDDLLFQKIRITNDIIVSHHEEKPGFVNVVVTTRKASVLTLAIAYFPGWRVFVDSHPSSVAITNGLMEVTVSEGVHTVTAYFGDTLVRSLGNGISFVFALSLLYVFFYKDKIKKDEN